jgi:hypothetical protein
MRLVGQTFTTLHEEIYWKRVPENRKTISWLLCLRIEKLLTAALVESKNFEWTLGKFATAGRHYGYEG